MRPSFIVIPVALLSLVTACGTSSEPVDETTGAPKTTAPATAAGGPTSGGGGGGGKVLNGVLGENDAFTIALTDDKGAPVTALKAGKYDIKIKDTSKIHNFHLSGPGVEQATTVPEVKDVTWSVTFKAGSYTFVCDPHQNMKGTFTVS